MPVSVAVQELEHTEQVVVPARAVPVVVIVEDQARPVQ
jgi:hypothetical protein